MTLLAAEPGDTRCSPNLSILSDLPFSTACDFACAAPKASGGAGSSAVIWFPAARWSPRSATISPCWSSWCPNLDETNCRPEHPDRQRGKARTIVAGWWKTTRSADQLVLRSLRGERGSSNGANIQNGAYLSRLRKAPSSALRPLLIKSVVCSCR